MPTASNITVIESVVPDIAKCASSETTNDCNEASILGSSLHNVVSKTGDTSENDSSIQNDIPDQDIEDQISGETKEALNVESKNDSTTQNDIAEQDIEDRISNENNENKSLELVKGSSANNLNEDKPCLEVKMEKELKDTHSDICVDSSAPADMLASVIQSEDSDVLSSGEQSKKRKAEETESLKPLIEGSSPPKVAKSSEESDVGPK